MDSTFVKYIEEIEKLYIHLPKSQRVRIEKWVEKLVSIGSNVVWRKHRNAYTKLLLNMVISKNISEPFNSLPPEGPLPSYPFHIKPITKDLIGVHETTFWRDLYKRLQEQDTKEHISLSHLDRSYHSGLPQSKSSPFGSNPLSREIDNLQILIKEQEQKILLLEQQLHEDRVKHELQIQRINYSHRMEIHQLLQNTQSNDGSQVPLSSHKLPSFLSHREVFPEKDFSLNRTSFGHVSINRSSSPTFESSNVFSKAKHISPNSHNTHINSAVTQNQWNQYDYNSNRLYQSYPSSNQTQPTEFESTRKFSGFEERSERNYQQPDFTATLLRDHPPIIPVPSDAMRDDSMNTSQVAFITNKQLFDNSRSIIDPHDISVSAAIPNPHIPEEFIRKDHSLSPTPVPDIIPSRKPSMTENSSMSSVEPNITHIPVHKQSQPLPNPVTYGNNITGTGIAEIFSSQNNQFLHEVSPEVEEDDEGEYELRGEENGGLLKKESSDEDFLNYLDKFQQQISIINVDS